MPVRNISSSSNPDIRRLKALRDRRDVRHAERLFVVEGPRFVRDATKVQAPEQLVLSETAACDWTGEALGSPDTIVIPDLLFLDVSTTQAPQGVLAIYSMVHHQPIRPAPLLTMVADGLQDPGNLGTIIRSAAANGASQVLCSAGTVDPYNPKVVRAAAGAHFLVPVALNDDLVASLDGSTIYVADGGAELLIDDVDWTVPSSVFIGGEARGPGPEASRVQAIPIAIPLMNGVESLNAGVAASIILYEAFRQRRHRNWPETTAQR